MARHLQAVPGGEADYLVREVEQAPVIPLANPAVLYLAELGDSSRPTVRSRLDIIAGLLQPGADMTTYDWSHVTILGNDSAKGRAWRPLPLDNL